MFVTDTPTGIFPITIIRKLLYYKNKHFKYFVWNICEHEYT